MKGKTCVVTGTTSGIGKETAVALAAAGARVAIVCRTRDKGERALDEIRQRSGGDVILFLADLGSQRAVRALAARLTTALPRVDVLVNNAGLILDERLLTEDGLETTFAVNHIGYFLLSRLLEPKLLASAPARVVNVASRAHHGATIRFDDLMGARSYDGWKAYAQSKLANIVFTYELARRLAGTGVTANCLHPGVIASNFGSAGPALIRLGVRIGRPLMKSSARGAETPIYLASSPEVEGVSGKYFVNRRAARSSDESYDPAVAARLWKVSEELTAASDVP
ncbi:MAG: short-chain dehydrogenase [Candidatus Rokuibacteriota bacterium]|nr:MAG: short-chain dehydrogenase [Candidatus Rokubacteria bacterium]